MPKYKACKICGKSGNDKTADLKKIDGEIICDACRLRKIFNELWKTKGDNYGTMMSDEIEFYEMIEKNR